MQPVHAYYLFNSLLFFGIGTTVVCYAPYLRSLGLTLGEISLVNAGFWITIIAAEVPTGMLADGRSRSWSLVWGARFFALGSLSYLCAQGFWSCLLSESAIGVGFAFLSGAQQAWVQAVLVREGRMHALPRVLSTASFIRSGGMLVGGVAGALIAQAWLPAIWLPLVLCGCLASRIAKDRMGGVGEPETRLTERQALTNSLALLAGSRALQWAAACLAAFGLVVAFNFFWSLYFGHRFGTFRLGFLWILMYGACAVGSLWVRRVGLPAGREGAHVTASLCLTGAALAAIPLTDGWHPAFWVLCLHEFARGVFEPALESFTLHRVDNTHAATYGSLQSLVGRVGFALVPLFAWLFLRDLPDTNETIAAVWIAAGSLMAAAALVLYLLRPRAAADA
ncbi:MFS transporter [Candidatus Uhrbacteria bacterium]|nr:MFS transporter [Candidatus Uhrbacteria bacterium]